MGRRQYWDYDDGLDADGYPLGAGLDADGYQITPEPRLRYRHGSEEEAGDWQPKPIGEAVAAAFCRFSLFYKIGPHCDSPIEIDLGAAILIAFERSGTALQLCAMADAPRSDRFALVPQFKWGFYRSDFAILDAGTAKTLLVECDGRDFHSSPEQLAHDAEKDRRAVERGFTTLRFTGSEITRNADDCARRIFDAVRDL